MRTSTSGLLLAAALLLAAGPLPGPAAAQDGKPDPQPFGGEGAGDDLPPPLTPEEEKAPADLFAEGKAAVAKGSKFWKSAEKIFKEFLKKYPGADPDMVREAEDRSGENCLAGIELMHDSGPSARRIDVELMGDGYIESKFKSFWKDAPAQMIEFWKEPLYEEG